MFQSEQGVGRTRERREGEEVIRRPALFHSHFFFFFLFSAPTHIYPTNYRDSTFTIGPKCSQRVKANMAFAVTLSLSGEGLEEGGRSYALSLGDTYLVRAGGAQGAEVLTGESKK
jgi:hypothetical protein